MRTISLRDVLRVIHVAFPDKSKMTEAEAILPENDMLMKEVLGAIGFDTRQGVLYKAANHRDMQNQVSIGYRVIGTINQDKDFLYSRACDTTERLAGSTAFAGDMSFVTELSKLCGIGSGITTMAEDLDFAEERHKVAMEAWGIEPDYDELAQVIQIFDDYCFEVRGDPLDTYGNVVRLGECPSVQDQ